MFNKGSSLVKGSQVPRPGTNSGSFSLRILAVPMLRPESRRLAAAPWSTRAALGIAAGALTFALTLYIRIRGISGHFWMLWDQIRDWGIVLGPFSELPLVGPPTHFGGYTIGPAFYWILWAIRVAVGPWFDNLPHAGGIGQAILQSGADTLLLAAVWHRMKSILMAIAVVVLLATSAYDLCLAPLVWNPVMGSILAKVATALVLLEWHRRSVAHLAATVAVAWCAVHAYTGAVYVAVAVFAAVVVEPLLRRDWKALRPAALAVVVTVAALQVPYVARQMGREERQPIMEAVTGSVAQVLTGREPPQIGKSLSGYVNAFSFIQGFPDRLPGAAWILIIGGLIVAIRHRHDPVLLSMTLGPQLLSLAGYAVFLGGLDHYYYLSVMPAAVLTTVLAVTAMPSPRARLAAILVVLASTFAQVPERLEYSARLHKMPEYGPLVEGSRKLARLGQPLRDIETEFTLPQPSDSTFVYRILGGEFDSGSPWVGRITASGDVVYRKIAE